MICPKRLAELVEVHLSNFKVKEHSWTIGVSKIAGRGVLAAKNIKEGEIIFRETPLLIGPAARNDAPLNACTMCYQMMDPKKCMCKLGCGLPICEMCSRKKQHKAECALFKSWEPVDPNTPNTLVIRMLTVARGLQLNKNQKDLLYCMQANIDTNFRNEVKNAAAAFKKFPAEKKIVEYLHRIVAVLNTNSFEPTSNNINQDYALRALYPLAGTMNNDCAPNAAYSFDEKDLTIVVRATKNILEEEEVTISYTKLFMGTLQRQLLFKMTKQFACRCARCSDPTELGTYISALYCRDERCEGLVCPEASTNLQPTWRCQECKKKYTHGEMVKAQDFAIGAVSSKLAGQSLKDIIVYINDKCPGFVPDSNHVVIDAKLNLIARMGKSKENFTFEEYQHKERYCDELMALLDKFGIGACPMRTYLIDERRK